MTGELSDLRRRRGALAVWAARRGREHELSLSGRELHGAIRPLIDRYAQEPCLDAGAGRSPYRRVLEARGLRVVSIDHEQRDSPLDLTGDIQDMPQVPSAGFGTVLCTQVLEHVPHPERAMAEFARVLKPGGTLILSAPHLSLIHEAPHDYHRFTRFALERLVREAGLELEVLEEAGGLVSFLSRPASVGLLSFAGAVPGLREVLFQVHRALVLPVLGWLDRLVGLRGIAPNNYILAARKPGGNEVAAGM